jgi:DeoR/GlpR family transcriptional regulator of sugar metabolism
MLKEERQRQIVELLGTEGKLIAAELCSRLGVSEDTIRRDLWELDAEGKVMRVHGGALSRLPQAVSYAERRSLHVEGKSAVGRVAASLVKDGQLLFLDGGTTTLQVARYIPKSCRLTVVTNSPPVAAEFNEHPAVEIILLGGRLLKESQVVVGQETVEQIQQFHADLVFLGTIHRKAGITIPHREEASVKRALMQCATKAVVVATADKLNTTAPYVVAPVEEISYLVTEASAGEPVLKKYRKLGITVLAA